MPKQVAEDLELKRFLTVPPAEDVLVLEVAERRGASVGSTTTSASYAMRRRYGVPASRPGIFGGSIVTSNSGPMNSDEASFLPDLSHVPRSFLADEAPAPCVTKERTSTSESARATSSIPIPSSTGGRAVSERCGLSANAPCRPLLQRRTRVAPRASAARHGRPVWHTHVVGPARPSPDAEAVCSRAQSGARHGRSDRFGNQETQVESPARDPRAGGGRQRWDLITELRRDRTAVVDQMGSEAIAASSAPGPTGPTRRSFR